LKSEVLRNDVIGTALRERRQHRMSGFRCQVSDPAAGFDITLIVALVGDFLQCAIISGWHFERRAENVCVLCG